MHAGPSSRTEAVTPPKSRKSKEKNHQKQKQKKLKKKNMRDMLKI